LTAVIRSILEKAAAKLKAAQVLLGEAAWDDAVSRAYYAAFHAVSALHLSRDNTFSSHAQLIGRFNKDFVKTGLFPQDFTRTLARLFEDRQTGDYDVTGTMAEEEARKDVEDAKEIVTAVTAYLGSAKNTDIDL
jgi:hypothetical protein